MENRRNLLVTLADKNYVRQAKQLFSSVYWNAGWEGDYLLLAHEVPDEELKWFKDKGIQIKKCMPLCHQITGEYNYPPVIFDKLYLFTPEFKKWKNIVFLDADIIVKASIERLTRVKYFAAAQDFYWSTLESQFYNPQNVKVADFDYELYAPAFNSGVFAFNTDLITINTFGELEILFKDYFTISKFAEQGILNLFFYNNWEKLPLIFHFFIVHHRYKVSNKLKFIIIHFIRNADFPALWEPGNLFYQEWITNLEKAEFIDLNKIQKVKKWSFIKVKYYSLMLNIIIGRFPKIIFIKIKYIVLRLVNFLIYLPGRFMGKTGELIKIHNPALYNKIRKIKDGK